VLYSGTMRWKDNNSVNRKAMTQKSTIQGWSNWSKGSACIVINLVKLCKACVWPSECRLPRRTKRICNKLRGFTIKDISILIVPAASTVCIKYSYMCNILRHVKRI
jgi:hypothetical protein